MFDSQTGSVPSTVWVSAMPNNYSILRKLENFIILIGTIWPCWCKKSLSRMLPKTTRFHYHFVFFGTFSDAAKSTQKMNENIFLSLVDTEADLNLEVNSNSKHKHLMSTGGDRYVHFSRVASWPCNNRYINPLLTIGNSLKKQKSLYKVLTPLLLRHISLTTSHIGTTGVCVHGGGGGHAPLHGN